METLRTCQKCTKQVRAFEVVLIFSPFCSVSWVLQLEQHNPRHSKRSSLTLTVILLKNLEISCDANRTFFKVNLSVTKARMKAKWRQRLLNSLWNGLILEMSFSSINRFFEDLTVQKINCKVLQNGPQGPVTTQNTSKRSFEYFKSSKVSLN